MAEKPGFNRVSQGSADEHSMAQIREILFGEQSRQTEQQFARLEARLGEQEQALKTLLDQRIDELGEQLHRLRDDLDGQEQRQGAALDDLHTTLSALLNRLDERLSVLDSDQQDARHVQQQAAADQAAALEGVERRSIGRAQLADLLEAMAGELRRPSDQ
jgi:hypothetical protein